MDAQLIAGGGALGVVVWLLAKVGRVLVKIAEALVAAAVVFLAVWLVVKGVVGLSGRRSPGGARA